MLLVDGGHLAQANHVCSRLLAHAPGCIVLVAGEESAHAGLEPFLGIGAADLLYLPVRDTSWPCESAAHRGAALFLNAQARVRRSIRG